MNSINLPEFNTFVDERVASALQKQRQSLENVTLANLLWRSPLLFLERNPSTSEVLKQSLNLYLAVTRDRFFKQLLVELVLFIVGQEGNGRACAIPGIDLELTHNNEPHHIIIQPWFTEIDKSLLSLENNTKTQPAIGVCYGTAFTGYLYGHLHFIGPHFWRLISHNENFYPNVIDPIRYRMGTNDDAFHKEKNALINHLTYEFTDRFCQDTGKIDWTRIIERDVDLVNDFL